MYFDRSATQSAAKRRGSGGMDRRSNAASVPPQAVSTRRAADHRQARATAERCRVLVLAWMAAQVRERRSSCLVPLFRATGTSTPFFRFSAFACSASRSSILVLAPVVWSHLPERAPPLLERRGVTGATPPFRAKCGTNRACRFRPWFRFRGRSRRRLAATIHPCGKASYRPSAGRRARRAADDTTVAAAPLPARRQPPGEPPLPGPAATSAPRPGRRPRGSRRR